MATLVGEIKSKRITVTLEGHVAPAKFGTMRDILADEFSSDRNVWVESVNKRDSRHTIVTLKRIPKKAEVSNLIDRLQDRLDHMIGDVNVDMISVSDYIGGPEDFPGEDTPHAPSASKIREELAAEGVTLREAKGALEDIEALKARATRERPKRTRMRVGRITKTQAGKLTIAELEARATVLGYDAAAREQRWKMEHMAAEGKVDTSAVYKALRSIP